MKKFRNLIALCLIVVISFIGGTYAESLQKIISVTEDRGITLNFNGDEFVARDGNDNVVYPILHNGTTYLPLRAVASAAGLKVDWNSKERKISLTTSDFVSIGDDGYEEELEINDIKADAHLIKDVKMGKIKGNVGAVIPGGKDEKDLYQFVLTENGVVGIEVLGSKSAQNAITVRDDSSGYDVVSYLSTSDNQGNYNMRLALKKGTYYIEISGESEEMPYRLHTTYEATPDDFEVDGSESEAKVFEFNGSTFTNIGAVGAGNDIYIDYVILDNFNKTDYHIDFEWKGNPFGEVLVYFYDENDYNIGDLLTINQPLNASKTYTKETLSGSLDQAIKKIVLSITPSVTDAICTEYKIMIK